MDEQEKFNQWWESKGVNSVILRAQAWSAWLARAEAEQPQPDPNEWVILDRDSHPQHVLRGCDFFETVEDSWHPVKFAIGHKLEDCKNFKRVRCRRYDLPKVERVKTDAGHDWSYHNQQKPQPKKRMLRLWIDPDCNIHAGLKGDHDLELHYDHETRQFYTEEQR